MPENKISIVMTARNDDYGGNFLNRINTSIRALIFLTKKYRFPIELIIVEYNPPPDKKSLAEVLKIGGNQFVKTRTITVPKEFHNRIAGDSCTPFLEYVAKNIGIRRAEGEFIITTNPDIIFGESFIKFLSESELNKNHFYRLNRHDLQIRAVEEDKPVWELLNFCPKNTTRIWAVYSLIYVSYKRWWKRFLRHPKPKNLYMCPIFNPVKKIISFFGGNKLHTAAAGDFLMAHRDAWATVRGFDQEPFNSYIDGYNLHLFHCHGFKQTILGFPIYHINHDTSNTIRRLMPLQEYRTNSKKMLKTKIPYKIYAEDWGFPKIQFKVAIVRESLT